MLILKYFVSVGAVLLAGLLALNAHLATPGQASVSKPTSASLPVAAPAAPKVEEAVAVTVDPAPPQQLKKPAAHSRNAKRSRSRHRAAR